MQSSLLVALTTFTFLIAPPTATAQCNGPAAVNFSRYGTTCNFFNAPALLGGTYDASSCTLTLSLSSPTTCCNTFLSNQYVLISARPISPGVPHPLLVAGCLLSTVPDVVLALPLSNRGIVSIRLPNIAGVTAYAQGLNDYFTTIGLTHDFQSSNGLQMDFL